MLQTLSQRTKSSGKRALAMLLVLLTVIGIFPDTAFAADATYRATGDFEVNVAGSTGWNGTGHPLPVYDSESGNMEIVTVPASDGAEPVPFTILEDNGGERVKIGLVSDSNGSVVPWTGGAVDGTGWVDKAYIFVNLPDVLPSIAYNLTNASGSIFTAADGTEIPGVTGHPFYAGKQINLRLDRKEYTVPCMYTLAQRLAKAEIRLTWAKAEKRIRQLIQEGSYLTPRELEKYQSDHLEQAQSVSEPDISAAEPFSNAVMNAYNATKAAHPDDIVLFQMGDFFEMYDEDARIAAPLLGLNLTTRPIPGAGRVEMCGIPAHALEQYAEKLRDKYDVTISAVDAQTHERGIYTLRSVDHEAEQGIDVHEAEFGADGTRVFRDPAAETSAPVIREQYDKYKPVVIAAVTEDTAYRNACGHSDQENAVMEGNAAIKRAIINSHDLKLIRLYSDVPEFRNRLHQEVIDETYPQLHELLRPLSKDDIDEALQTWNGSLDSKRRVVRYMEEHGRERSTAEWLSREYGGATDKNLFVIRQGSPETVELPWSKVQRRIAQLIKEDRFFTQQELDDFEDIDTAAVREQLESGEPSAFVEQVMADMGQSVTEVPDLTSQHVTREGDTITIGSGDAVHEFDITASDEEWQTLQEIAGAADQPSHDPLAPAYRVGDTVYLDNTAFEITNVGLFDVQMRDPALPIPIFRAESKENFERMLFRDSRNGRITSYLPANMKNVNDDFREVLTSHLLTDQDKDYIAMWIRSGQNNRGIAMRLSEALANRNDTVTLETGDTVDYFASTVSLEVDIQDKFNTRLSMSWDEIAPVLRALWLQELDGFSHEPVQREPVNLEGKLSYQVGDKVAFAYGDHDVSGTIEGIGNFDILIHTGPYAWSHQTVTKDFFEDAVRHDERNAHLFTQEVPEQTAPETAMISTIYPGDKNNMP